MTKSYVVSGLGMRFGEERCRVPDHVEIHFYLPRREAPRIFRPRNILEELMVEVGVFPYWISGPGELMPLHLCWAHPEGGPRSGVFRRATGDLVIDLAGTSAERPVALSHIVDQIAHRREAKSTVLHWLAPTTEAAGASTGLKLRWPMRRPQGAVPEADESRRVANGGFRAPAPHVRISR